MRAAGIALLAACGRLEFDPLSRVDASADAIPLGPFGPPVRITALSSAGHEQEPTFPSDRLEVYFRRGVEPNGGDLFRSTRATIDAAWDPPAAVTELNTASHEYTPGISPDGLTIWFGSNRAGGIGLTDIWVSTRTDRGSPWSPPMLVPGINTTSDDLTPAVSADGSVLMLTSKLPGQPDVYAAMRASATTWNPPQPVVELNTPSADGSARLWAAMLAVVFDSNRSGTGRYDLWMATRTSLTSSFADLVELTELNSPDIDWDPWISEDGRYLMFGSDRSGDHEIYESSR